MKSNILLFALIAAALMSSTIIVTTISYEITDQQRKELSKCRDDGYKDGRSIFKFDQDEDSKCLKLNEKVEEGPGSVSSSTYYKNWVRGCMSIGNSKETCETYPDD